MNSYQDTSTVGSNGPRRFASLWFAAAILFLAAVVPAGAQVPTSPQLTDAQVAALMQTLAAQAQNPAASALTQAQFQQLLQYMARQNPTGSSAAANAAQLQMMQALAAQSSLAAPNTAVSAAQAQMLMQTMAAHRQAGPKTDSESPFTANSPTATGASTLGPKKPGAIRVGIAQPRAQLGQGNSGNNVAEPIRAMIIQYLSGPMIEVAPLTSMLATQLDAEAKQKECDYIIYSSMTMTQNSGGMGLLKKAMPMASMIPMVGAARGIAGAATAAAAGSAMSGISSVTGTVKAKSEVKFEFQLMAQGNTTPLLANALTAKAHTDGEDVITPLIEKADEAILAAVTRK